MHITLYVLLAVFACISGVLAFFHYDISEQAHYVTSEQCEQCHRTRYTSYSAPRHVPPGN